MTEFRRGFKTWCEKTAAGFRRDLNLTPFAALCPRELAKHLGILVWSPDEIPDFQGRFRDQLLVHDSSSWSALTLERAGQRVIVVNSSHSVPRQNSNVMHELAHVILEHEAARVDVSPQGLMLLETYDLQQEAEADWLGGALLVPREAPLIRLKQNRRLELAAAYFGVSVQLIRMRRDTTGIGRQLSYQRAS
jgi:hypothetical protein